jgi:hypothetical protein
MADRPLHLRSDDQLEVALRGLGESIAWPAAGSLDDAELDLAGMVRARLETAARSGVPARTGRSARTRADLLWRPAPRALLAAAILLLALAALAGASVLGLPGLRLILGPAPVTASPPPSLGPSQPPGSAAPGAVMKLGGPVPLADLDARAGFTVTLPSDPLLGAPDAAYLDPALSDQVALVWGSRPGLPDTREPGVGLILTEFRGAVDDGFFSKALGGGTTAQPVLVHGQRAFWLTGDPHLLFYTGRDGFAYDGRRWIGDALLWARGPITYRIETSLGRDWAIRTADSMP